MTIQESLELANSAAKNLTEEMNAIFAGFPHLECEEQMPDYAYNQWSALWQLRKGIFDRKSRLEAVSGDLATYILRECI